MFLNFDSSRNSGINFKRKIIYYNNKARVNKGLIYPYQDIEYKIAEKLNLHLLIV